MESLLSTHGRSQDHELASTALALALPILVVAVAAAIWLLGQRGKQGKREVASTESKGATVGDEQQLALAPPSSSVEVHGTLIPSTGLIKTSNLQPYAFENGNCIGRFLPLHRPTSDAKLESTGSYPYSDHFKGRKRLWEFRIEMQFKAPVDGNLLIGIELEDYVPLSAASKRFMGITVSALRQVVGGDLYHSVGDDPRHGQAPHEKPVFMMPIWACDQIIVTPEGEVPPSLTDSHFASYGLKRAEDRKAFVKELEAMRFVPGPTYTFGVWGISQFLDCMAWKVEKIVPFKSIDFNTFCGRPPVTVCLYTLLPGSEGDVRHLQSRKNFYFRYALWSSNQSPSPQKIRELIPSDGDLGKRAGPTISQQGFMQRWLGCCSVR